MSPYDEGRIAAAGRLREDGNPYGDGTYHHAEWSRGFHSSAESEPADEAFNEGKLAASQGVDVTANPYDGSSDIKAEKAGRWLAGYEYAMTSDEDGEPVES